MNPKPPAEGGRLEQENAQLRGDLLTLGSRIAHDLRTPLGSILNTAELLKEILAEKDPASVSLTGALFESVDDLRKLVKSVHFVTKATIQPQPKERLSMGEVVRGIMEQFENRIQKKAARVGTPATWPEVEGVSVWLEFIWWQLISNALQHGGPDIQIGWAPETAGHRFWISDNGVGVPAAARGKLFQPFETLHQQDSTRGLGLSIVERLVTLQQGNCGYEPNPNGGGLFFFTLPLISALK